MSCEGTGSTLEAAPAVPPQTIPSPPKNRLFVHQLSRGDDTKPAIFVAEAFSWSADELTAAAKTLSTYHRKHVWVDKETKHHLYTFICHDTRSTKTIEIIDVAGHEKPRETPVSATNPVVAEALKNKTLATFVVLESGAFQGGALIASFDMSHLRRFL